jgi:hypothetical protein
VPETAIGILLREISVPNFLIFRTKFDINRDDAAKKIRKTMGHKFKILEHI